MDRVKDHFENEANEFDSIIQKLIPYYNQMVNALVDAIPFEKTAPIRILDLGCGTGTISQQISQSFPNSKIVCLDIASKMVEIAKQKLARHSDAEFITGDFSKVKFIGNYDVVVSSLALHHLETDDHKKAFYLKIFNLLNDSGVFFNADVVLASTEFHQQMYMQRWIDFMCTNVPKDEIENIWIPTYEAEDRPAMLMDQIHWLEEIGFSSVDVIWKYYNFAVYGGVK